MKTLPAVLLLAAALATPVAAISNDGTCGAGRSPDRHLYAFAYFHNASPNAKRSRVIGNAFAVHAVALNNCDPDSDCEASGRPKWRLLFATAAHVIKDVCLLQKSTQAGTVNLVVPARPSSVDSNTVRIAIDENFCAQNAEAENFTNNLFTIARQDGLATRAETLGKDDIRKNSDQWFFAADIETPEGDVVQPVMMGPLRASKDSKGVPINGKGIPLRYNAFQNGPLDDDHQVEEGVWWTQPKEDDIFYFNSGTLQSVYVASDWTTAKGASGSPVLEVLANGTQVRAVGIVTQFFRMGCTKAAGTTRSTTTDSDMSVSEDDPQFEMTNDVASCLNDTIISAQADDKTTSFVPVLRFPTQLRTQFVLLNGKTFTPTANKWTRSPELLSALRALVRSRQKSTIDSDKDALKRAIDFLASEIPPYEMAFMMSGLASAERNAVSADLLSTLGCPRIEPSFGTAR